MGKPDWMEEEQQRAEELTETGKTTNNAAPKLERVKRAPKRKQKAFYLQEQHADAFELLVIEQKKQGLKAPELIESAIELLLKKHGKKL